MDDPITLYIINLPYAAIAWATWLDGRRHDALRRDLLDRTMPSLEKPRYHASDFLNRPAPVETKPYRPICRKAHKTSWQRWL
jgi:hypothetical protein